VNEIKVFISGDPKGQPRAKAFVRGGHAAVYNPTTAEGWKSRIAEEVKPYLPESPHDGPVVCDLTFFFRRPQSHYGKRKGKPYLKDKAPRVYTNKPDRDNLDKAVMDCLTQIGLWKDDCLVYAVQIVKLYADEGYMPGLQLNIRLE